MCKSVVIGGVRPLVFGLFCNIIRQSQFVFLFSVFFDIESFFKYFSSENVAKSIYYLWREIFLERADQHTYRAARCAQANNRYFGPASNKPEINVSSFQQVLNIYGFTAKSSNSIYSPQLINPTTYFLFLFGPINQLRLNCI